MNTINIYFEVKYKGEAISYNLVEWDHFHTCGPKKISDRNINKEVHGNQRNTFCIDCMR